MALLLSHNALRDSNVSSIESSDYLLNVNALVLFTLMLFTSISDLKIE